ncbi:cell fate (sporulation/competence/biofilm development) regulator YlbF (YheA/YmcA/DUF963 family) [Catalinimonas alkaloidigena]|uniref:hypothetical protein n=1 Tax=Catalinimonas alkaloidigena TaxID=1075417 RepID=UPI002405E0CA|nr:hypothetical protein [Catalinimonas alkaloidigena]MDF9798962.1 cell fate (sporulation/competence/biofilm development) regulator YlbF (YheA/YmcA/DUF963 family) [Catalinimonas alkaloidigena]
MHSVFINLYVIAFLLTMSCQPSSKASVTDEKYVQAQEIYQEAIEVHEEVMSHMDEIARLKSLLNKRIDTLQQRGGEEMNTDLLQRMQEIVQKLEKADEAMMQWGHNVKKVHKMYDAQSTNAEVAVSVLPDDTTNLIRVLQLQNAAIEQVKTLVESSIKEAHIFLVLPE